MKPNVTFILRVVTCTSHLFRDEQCSCWYLSLKPLYLHNKKSLELMYGIASSFGFIKPRANSSSYYTYSLTLIHIHQFRKPLYLSPDTNKFTVVFIYSVTLITENYNLSFRPHLTFISVIKDHHKDTKLKK